MGSSKWGYVTDWYIDPGGLLGGNDENSGLTSGAPIKSIAEWRRRISGAVFTGNGPVIHALSGSTVTDDGMFYGFSTPDLATYVRLTATPTLTGLSGAVGSYVPYSGNTRGQFTDSAIPTSWTASGGISGASGSRFVRKVASSGVRHYAPLLIDLTAKSVQMGIVVDWDETDAVTTQTTETNLANGDAYEVVSMPAWPAARAVSGNVLLQCFDIQGFVSPTFRKSLSVGGILRYRLCGFPQNVPFGSANAIALYSCAICMASPSGITASGPNVSLTNCSLSNSAIFEYGGPFTWTGTSNVIANGELRFWHAALGGSLGNLRCFDCALPLLSVRHDSSVRINSGVVGSGNSGALINCDTAGIAYGAVNIVATTSASHIYTINGVGHDSPAAETSGDAVYA